MAGDGHQRMGCVADCITPGNSPQNRFLCFSARQFALGNLGLANRRLGSGHTAAMLGRIEYKGRKQERLSLTLITICLTGEVRFTWNILKIGQCAGLSLNIVPIDWRGDCSFNYDLEKETCHECTKIVKRRSQEG